MELRFGSETIVQDCYLDVDSTELIRVFPFQHSKMLIVIKIFLYLFLIIDWILKFKENVNRKLWKYLCKPISMWDYYICWIGLFLLAFFIYKVIGIPNYLHIGDESEYWNALLLNNGKWDVAMLAERFAPRGYWCYIPQSIAHYLGDFTKVDPSVIWMIIPSATISWLVVKLFPGIYEIMGGKAKILHIIPILIVMITTWRDCLTVVCMDLFGVVFLFAGIYYILLFFKTKKWTRAIFAGILSSIACSFRVANLLGIVSVVIYGIISFFVHKKYDTERSIWRIVFGIVLWLFSFVIISIPQLQVNLYRNHKSLLPYDHDQAWFGRSLTVWSSDYAMMYGDIAYPVVATDDQMLTMKSNTYVKDVSLNMNQLFDTYLDSPIETIMLIGKKLIIGFDKKTNISYPIPNPGVPWRETSGILFSLWNYFVLFAGGYTIIKGKKITNKERIFTLLILIFLVLPETFMKIEWRHIFAGYMIIYYFFTFHFVGELALLQNNRVELLEQSRFLLYFVVFAITYLTFSFIFLA